MLVLRWKIYVNNHSYLLLIHATKLYLLKLCLGFQLDSCTRPGKDDIILWQLGHLKEGTVKLHHLLTQPESVQEHG
jgi:hypothetical protein